MATVTATLPRKSAPYTANAVQNTHGRRRLARAPSSISPAPATRAPRAVPPTLGIRSGASSTPAAMSPAPTPKSTPNSSASPPLA
ncbi:hypothetical protein ACFQXA_21400 [Nocardiopsis composta]